MSLTYRLPKYSGLRKYLLLPPGMSICENRPTVDTHVVGRDIVRRSRRAWVEAWIE